MWIFFFFFTIGWYWDCELTATVCEAIETVTFVTHTLKASRVVDADVVTCSLKGTLINICRGQKHTFTHTTPSKQITVFTHFLACSKNHPTTEFHHPWILIMSILKDKKQPTLCSSDSFLVTFFKATIATSVISGTIYPSSLQVYRFVVCLLKSQTVKSTCCVTDMSYTSNHVEETSDITF